MKKGFVWMGAALAAVSVLGVTGVASASSHREAPAISKDPAADNTDVWAWMEGNGGTTLHVVAAYNPMELPEGGPNFHSFSDDVLYEVHLTRGATDVKDVVKYQVKFKTAPYKKIPLVLDAADTTKARPNKDTKIGALAGDPDGLEFFSQIAGGSQTYTVTKVVNGVATDVITNAPVAPANIGTRTNKVAYGFATGQTYESKFGTALAATSTAVPGFKAWTGPRDDGFYVDLGAFFDLANLRSLTATGGKDGVAGFNCHAIALDIPITDIPAGTDTTSVFKDRVGVWASASRRKVSILRNDGSTSSYGPWVQVSRLGLPLINEVVIGLQDKDKYNRTTPETDVANFGPYILAPVLVRDAEAVGIYTALAVPTATVEGLKQGRADIITAMNVLAPIGAPTDATPGFPLAATGDVLRVELNKASGFPNGRPLTAGKTETDVTDILSTIVLTGLDNFAANGATIKDGVSENDGTYLAAIPYLPSPWEGRSQGISVRLGAAPPVDPTPLFGRRIVRSGPPRRSQHVHPKRVLSHERARFFFFASRSVSAVISARSTLLHGSSPRAPVVCVVARRGLPQRAAACTERRVLRRRAVGGRRVFVGFAVGLDARAGWTTSARARRGEGRRAGRSADSSGPARGETTQARSDLGLLGHPRARVDSEGPRDARSRLFSACGGSRDHHARGRRAERAGARLACASAAEPTRFRRREADRGDHPRAARRRSRGARGVVRRGARARQHRGRGEGRRAHDEPEAEPRFVRARFVLQVVAQRFAGGERGRAARDRRGQGHQRSRAARVDAGAGRDDFLAPRRRGGSERGLRSRAFDVRRFSSRARGQGARGHCAGRGQARGVVP
jgi:CBS domain-containing protein